MASWVYRRPFDGYHPRHRKSPVPVVFTAEAEHLSMSAALTFAPTLDLEVAHPLHLTASLAFSASLSIAVHQELQLSAALAFRPVLFVSIPPTPVSAGVPDYRVENDLQRQTGLAVWYDVLTDRLEHAVIERGRPDELAGTTAGTMTLTLDNDDGALDLPGGALGGWFDGAYPVRIVANFDGTDYVLGTGYVDEVTHQARGAIGSAKVLRTVDLFKELGQARPVNYSIAGLGPVAFPPASMGDRLHDLLDSVGVALSGERVFSAGAYNLRADQPQDTPFLQLVDWICKLEAVAIFFERGDGKLVFQSRAYREQQFSAGVFGIGDGAIPVKSYTVKQSFDGIYNEVHVFRPSYSKEDQVATDGASIERYGRSVYTLDSKAADQLDSDADALAWAESFLHTYRQPRYRVDTVTIDPYCGPLTAEAWGHVLTREIGDRITLNLPLNGSSGVVNEDYHIEGLRHEIDFNGLEHLVTWRVSRRAGTVGV